MSNITRLPGTPDSRRRYQAGDISTDDAKFLLLAVVYGATLARSQKENQRAIEQRLGLEATDRLRGLPLVLDLYGDVRRIGKAVLLDYQAKRKRLAFWLMTRGARSA